MSSRSSWAIQFQVLQVLEKTRRRLEGNPGLAIRCLRRRRTGMRLSPIFRWETNSTLLFLMPAAAAFGVGANGPLIVGRFGVVRPA